ncbi:MAG: hypothetical protein PHS17_03235 [Desulfobacterales bacterium]|nr:hypothetical protein [Desulfobacterales bacterium]
MGSLFKNEGVLNKTHAAGVAKAGGGPFQSIPLKISMETTGWLSARPNLVLAQNNGQRRFVFEKRPHGRPLVASKDMPDQEE